MNNEDLNLNCVKYSFINFHEVCFQSPWTEKNISSHFICFHLTVEESKESEAFVDHSSPLQGNMNSEPVNNTPKPTKRKKLFFPKGRSMMDSILLLESEIREAQTIKEMVIAVFVNIQ